MRPLPIPIRCHHNDWGYHLNGKSLSVRKGFSIMMCLWGLAAILIFGATALSRATLAIDGTVISAVRVKDPSGPYRYYEDYVIRPSDGKPLVNYRAGYNDAALSREIPIGAYLHKEKWQLSYTVDGQKFDDFPTLLYLGTVTAGVIAVASGITLLVCSTKVRGT